MFFLLLYSCVCIYIYIYIYRERERERFFVIISNFYFTYVFKSLLMFIYSVCVYICMCVFMYICSHLCVCVCVCLYTHTLKWRNSQMILIWYLGFLLFHIFVLDTFQTWHLLQKMFRIVLLSCLNNEDCFNRYAILLILGFMSVNVPLELIIHENL